MDGLADILKNKDFDIPPEALAIKSYVKRHFDTDVSVTVQQRSILVSSRSSGLIATLRMHVSKIQKVAETDKYISFRIGGS